MNVGDVVYCSTETKGEHLVEVSEMCDDIGEYCDLEGPGFIGALLMDEHGYNVHDEAIELCYTLDMVTRAN